MIAVALFVALALVLLAALAAGQFRMASRAMKLGKAGFGRFTYRREDNARAFWIAVAAEWAGFAVLFVYCLSVVAKVLSA